MNGFYVDPSALVKRYAAESGTDLMELLVSELLAAGGSKRLCCALSGIGETLAVLNRKRNDGRMTASEFAKASKAYLTEIKTLLLHGVDERVVFASLALITKHNINSTDAIHLQVAQELRRVLRAFGDELVLVASDKRLVRAAAAEGFPVFDPETGTEVELRALL